MRLSTAICVITPLTVAGLLLAGESGQKKTGDADIDWLLSQATTRASTREAEPTTQPVSPFAAPADESPARHGTVELSDGKKLSGKVRTTREKPLRIWDEKDKEYRDIPLDMVKNIEARVLWERDQKEWHFPDAGSDIKEFSGKTYPARELEYKFTLINGQTVTGGVVAPLYVADGKKQTMLVLHKRQKGELGQKLKDLVYVRKVELLEE